MHLNPFCAIFLAAAAAVNLYQVCVCMKIMFKRAAPRKVHVCIRNGVRRFFSSRVFARKILKFNLTHLSVHFSRVCVCVFAPAHRHTHSRTRETLSGANCNRFPANAPNERHIERLATYIYVCGETGARVRLTNRQRIIIIYNY